MRHESDLQSACVRWFRYQYPMLAPLLFAVPNGGYRNQIEATRLKDQGVVPGVSDLILLKSNGTFSTLCIEMKVGYNKQTDLQRRWEMAAESNGNHYVVCRTFEEFKHEIEKYLKDEKDDVYYPDYADIVQSGKS